MHRTITMCLKTILDASHLPAAAMILKPEFMFASIYFPQ